MLCWKQAWPTVFCRQITSAAARRGALTTGGWRVNALLLMASLASWLWFRHRRFSCLAPRTSQAPDSASSSYGDSRSHRRQMGDGMPATTLTVAAAVIIYGRQAIMTSLHSLSPPWRCIALWHLCFLTTCHWRDMGGKGSIYHPSEAGELNVSLCRQEKHLL